jgi:hypothetical protein
MHKLDTIAIILATAIPTFAILNERRLNKGPFSGLLMAEGSFRAVASQAQNLKKRSLFYAKHPRLFSLSTHSGGIFAGLSLAFAALLAHSSLLIVALCMGAFASFSLVFFRSQKPKYTHREANFYGYMLGLVMVNLNAEERRPILEALAVKLFPSQASALARIAKYLTAEERALLAASPALKIGDSIQHQILREQMAKERQPINQSLKLKTLESKVEKLGESRTNIQRNPVQRQSELEQLNKGIWDLLGELEPQSQFLARPEAVYCKACHTFIAPQRIDVWQYFHCNGCQSAANLQGDVLEVIAWLGKGNAPEPAQGQLIFSAWDTAKRKALPAEIDAVWLDMTLAEDLDWAVNAFLALSGRPQHRGKLQWQAIGEGELAENTLRILEHTSGNVQPSPTEEQKPAPQNHLPSQPH